MNEFNFEKRHHSPPGFDPAICPAPPLHPRKVVLYGHVAASPYTVFSAPGVYAGVAYAQGTYAGTHPAVPIFYGTVTAPGVYEGTVCASEFGFEVPYGWTGAMFPGTYYDMYGTFTAVPRKASLVNVTTDTEVNGLHMSITPLAYVASPTYATEYHLVAGVPGYPGQAYARVTLSCATSGATIYYQLTMVGQPTSPFGVYSAALDVACTYPVIINAFAYKIGMEEAPVEVVTTLTYPWPGVVPPQVATPQIQCTPHFVMGGPEGSTPYNWANITCSCATTGAKLYYNIAPVGQQPGSWIAYTGEVVPVFTVSSVFSVIASKSGMADSTVSTTLLTPRLF